MYGQQQGYNQPNGMYGQQQPLQQQQTGYNFTGSFQQPQDPQRNAYGGMQQPLQQQYTQGLQQVGNANMNAGYPQQNGLYAQNTGFAQSQYQNQQPIYTQPLQQQQTGFTMPQQSQYQLPTQQTGYQPQAMQATFQQPYGAQGFSGFGAMPMQTQQQPFIPQTTSQQPAAPKLKIQKTGANIPPTRLSFVNANDQAKFENIFAKAVGPYNTALPGNEARAILTKSGLPSSVLSKIWSQCDTTRSGQLLFPEFVLAMHLCNTALRQGNIPNSLDQKTMNEVTSVVDQIQFAAVDTTPHPAAQAMSQPNFAQNNVALLTQTFTGARPMMSNGNSQQFQAMYQQPQQTGYVQPYQYGQGLQPGLTGVQQPGLTGFGTVQPTQQQQQQQQYQFPITALQAQPTGRPGEWGFVRAPQDAVQGMQALGAMMMPGGGGSSQSMQITTAQQPQNIPWAITKEEKAIYDTIHKAWDKKNQGYVEGPVAIEVFGTSGLPRSDLELIWALADADDKGKLNSDEFAVALHLIYRKLNGLEIPPVLPPELIPPSTRNFGDSIAQVKSMLQQEASARTGPTSYMKNRSFKESSTDYSKDGTVYKHDDRGTGYVSSARRRAPADSARASPAPDHMKEESAIADLKKQVREKQVLIDAMDDGVNNAANSEINRQARQEADNLYREIRKVQQQLDNHSNSHMLNGAEERDKSNLQRQLQVLVDKLPEIAAEVRAIEQKIQERQLQIFNSEEAKNNPASAAIVGTGPGGEITEADRRRAKTKAMMEARMAALTGKPVAKTDENALEAASRRQADKAAELRRAKEANEQMIRDIEESASSLRTDIESALTASDALQASEHERRRWNEGVGVESEVREFIRELNKGIVSVPSSQQPQSQSRPSSTTVAPSAEAAVPARTATPTYNTFNAAEDRAAYLKQQAEARMAERLAALGIRPSKKKEVSTPPAPKTVPDTRAEDERREAELKAKQEKQAQEEQEQIRKQQEDEARRAEAEKAATQIKATPSPRADTSARPDSKASRLAKLQADRAARLAEEERLERELAEESSSDDEPVVIEKQEVPIATPVVPKAEPIPAAPPVNNNPYHNFKNETSDAPVQSKNPFAKTPGAPITNRPPPLASTQPQRTNAPRAKPVRKNSDDWSNASKDESSSDEEGPSPADLAARLFSGGMQPQRTGAQTPLSAQRTGAAPSPVIPQAQPIQTNAPPGPPPVPSSRGSSLPGPPPAPILPPGPPPAPILPSGPPPAPILPSGPPPAPILPSSAPPAPVLPPGPPPAPFGLPPGPPPGPPPMPFGSAPPPPPFGAPPPPSFAPPAPAAPTFSAPVSDGSRNALLSSIQAGKGLRKVKTVEKGGVSGGRVID